VEGAEITAEWRKEAAALMENAIAEGSISQESSGRVVMTIAVLAAASLIAAAVAWLIGSAVQRQVRGQPMQHREIPRVPQHLESGE
jgi:hypothetical protein